MKIASKVGYMAIGAALMGVLALPASQAAAALAQKNITVAQGVKICVDDKQLNNASGFIYDGTTYLPVRAVAEAVGKPVTWDGKNFTVYMGTHSSEEPAVMLTDLDYFRKSTGYIENFKDNLGRAYNAGITRGTVEYKLNGMYRELRGKWILNYDNRSSTYSGILLKIYGDDKLLYTSPEMTGGVEPVDVSVDITGVLTLKIEISGGAYLFTNENACIFADPALYQ